MADCIARKRAAASATADNDVAVIDSSPEEISEMPNDTPEGSALYAALVKQGVLIVDEDSLRDFRTVMKMVRGMKDRVAGKGDTDECMMLECLGQALGYTKDTLQDDSFDDLLSKLD